MVIKVIQEFTEVKTGRVYKPGDIVDDPRWLDNNNARAKAYAARGRVEIIEEAAPEVKRPARKKAGD